MPQWYEKEFRATHDEHEINLITIDMVRVARRPSGQWKAHGWWKVWHMGEEQPTIEAAFRSLIDTVAVYVEADKNDRPI